ncbi:MAG: hypothetical protein KKH41_09460 [Candidatus Thermoplasmatota archaeon]|nr:hypothetical protein [Euryarchaeota archaeon]MBU4032221.1 hypothetical protein [Candidatus Thermoplasmatota archaeon]MBU4072247.1 hypothetical protein [Candidatus Thermoplasmatota archaeon]MBU4143655.1 hypothetical protein [Candidatus Thermoplasmatota archaeon]MBU4592792.1 hypothetical protein [Candidatus Thermoplasmatota archaeon]
MFGKKNAITGQDRTTKQLQKSGVYTLGHGPHPYVVGNETVEAVKTKKIYSFWSGVWYTTVLSLLLFWLPPFGQMIAGYVGGRKAGTPQKGALAAFAPMSLIFLLFIMRYMGTFVGEIDWFLNLPTEGANLATANIPVMGPVFGFMFNYIQTFISAMWSHEFFIYPYVLTVIFGYVGGILSLQHQREMEDGGRGHPFIPVAIISPQAISMQEPQPSADPGFQNAGNEPGVVMGKIPDGWNLKKDKKKGKW